MFQTIRFGKLDLWTVKIKSTFSESFRVGHQEISRLTFYIFSVNTDEFELISLPELDVEKWLYFKPWIYLSLWLSLKIHVLQIQFTIMTIMTLVLLPQYLHYSSSITSNPGTSSSRWYERCYNSSHEIEIRNFYVLTEYELTTCTWMFTSHFLHDRKLPLSRFRNLNFDPSQKNV